MKPSGTTSSAPNRLKLVLLPASYNYVGAFLTFRCPYHCSYCINRFHGHEIGGYPEMSGSDWITFFSRLETRDVPVTLQGGEPGLHPDFITIVEEISQFQFVDILTNLAFDLNAFAQKIPPQRLNREAPYAPIRVSYHPEQFSLEEITKRILFLQDAGFRVGLYGVTHPAQAKEIEHARKVCADLGIDFRTKPFLGRHKGTLYGDYTYPEACSGTAARWCECATSELLIAPNGEIHRCHQFLYERRRPLAHVTDHALHPPEHFMACGMFGHCNPCDVKVKNNRFQQFGHTAMKIRNVQPPPRPGN